MNKNKRSPLKKLKQAFYIICFAYVISVLFPELSFKNKHTYKNFTVYYHESNSMDLAELTSVLDESLNLLQKSEQFDSNKNQDIFLCDNFNEFSFYVLFARKSFGVNFPLTKNIFLSKSSISENIAYRNKNQQETKALSSVIAHKTTHSFE